MATRFKWIHYYRIVVRAAVDQGLSFLAIDSAAVRMFGRPVIRLNEPELLQLAEKIREEKPTSE